MKYILLFGLMLFKGMQAQQITWQKYLGSGSTGQQRCGPIFESPDSGFIMGALLYQIGYGSCLVKCDRYGDTLWTKNYNAAHFSFDRTFDGGYILFGGAPGGANLIKTDSLGNIQFTKQFPAITFSGHVIQTLDSGYLIGYQNALIKTDTAGNILWTTYTSMYSCANLLECKNGDVLATGNTTPYKYYAVLINAEGYIKWAKILGSFPSIITDSKILSQTIELPDINFLAVATNDKNSFYLGCGFDIAKISRATGDTLWTKNIAFTSASSYCAFLSKGLDSTVFICLDNELARLDFEGNLIWKTTLWNRQPHWITGCSDEGLAIGGTYASSILPGSLLYAFYAKLDSLGNIYNFQSVPELAINELRVYPNPASHQLTINHLQLTIGKPVTVTVYDVMGKLHLQQTQTAQGDVKVEPNTLPSGMYVLQLQQADRLFTGRFVKE